MLLLNATTSEADQIWIWSFAGEQGHFLTDGTTPVPGTYTLIDFDVTSSAAGGTLGSVSGGQYVAAGSDSVQPYSMAWNGSAVTLWSAAGFNSFNWWPFSDLVEPPKAYCLASEQGLQGRSMMSTRPLSGVEASISRTGWSPSGPPAEPVQPQSLRRCR